jgi:hypothetical protein
MELARRNTSDSSGASKRELTDKEVEEKKEIDCIMQRRKQYEQDRKSKEKEWTESYKMYMSWVDKVVAPFVSNLFIPKTHEAVELLAAFLIGNNQSITAAPEEGSTNTMKAKVAGKYLEFLWRKTLKARLKILVWIKQAIVFGNGVMKFGWDPVAKQPWMNITAIEDVYFDYFEPDIQKSEYVIHEIRRDKVDVVNDTKYNALDHEGKLIREQVVEGGQAMTNTAEALFDTYDGSFKRSENKGKVLVMEVWTKKDGEKPQKIITLLPTSIGWRIARKADNPNKWKDGVQFRPFSKVRFKLSPLPNRAYDTGMVWPTVGIQKSFNDLTNEYFDAVAVLGSPTWLKRRGARINPQELIRRPGNVITVSDINKDLKREPVGDVPSSLIEMLNRLDREFQEASMIVNLLKGMSQSDTATGDAIAQQNVQTLLSMIDQNIAEALSEAGQMVLAIALNNKEGKISVKMFETQDEIATMEADPADINGMHDVRIAPDRDTGISKAVINKGLRELLAVVGIDAALMGKYPTLKEKLIKRIIENEGVGDADAFFEEEGTPAQAPEAMMGPAIPRMQLPAGPGGPSAPSESMTAGTGENAMRDGAMSLRA